jgi:hypothetical protein
MFLATACNFILATIFEGAYLASAGTSIQTRLIEYGDRPLADTLQLVARRLLKPGIAIQWITSAAVRILGHTGLLNGLALIQIHSAHYQ